MKINEKNLCVFATSPPYDCEGCLLKRGFVNKSFLRRYFILKGNLLFYFEKKGDKDPLGLIIVEGCTIELSEESDQYCFEIAFNGNRTYILCAESQEIMERWMKALTCAGYEYKKLMIDELQRKLKEIESSRDKKLTENVINLKTVPKPPRRRPNPFNHAPPVPIQNGTREVLHTSTANTNKPVTNGFVPLHLYVEKPKAKPRVKSAFYVERQEPNGSQAGALCLNTIFAQINGTSANFKEMHEIYREAVTKSVLEYRRKKESNSRLIDI